VAVVVMMTMMMYFSINSAGVKKIFATSWRARKRYTTEKSLKKISVSFYVETVWSQYHAAVSFKQIFCLKTLTINFFHTLCWLASHASQWHDTLVLQSQKNSSHHHHPNRRNDNNEQRTTNNSKSTSTQMPASQR
jgi:hypothetical protein